MAASSIQGTGDQNLARKLRQRSGGASAIALTPWTARRRSASAVVSPAAEAPAAVVLGNVDCRCL